MLSARTASGKVITIERLAKAESAVSSIALNNKALLEQRYGTTREDVQMLVELAHEVWFLKSRKGE
jgi:hypothetical protein